MMPRTRNPYPAEFREKLVALSRAGRSVEDLAREFERFRIAPPPASASFRQDNCPRKLSGHHRPQSREDSHNNHKPFKVGQSGRLP